MTLYIIEIKDDTILSIKKAGYEDLKELVYTLVQLIPICSTSTYGDIAKILRTSPRLVGRILRENPNPIAIPCHRVVGSKSLGGYTIKGRRAPDTKQKLLILECGRMPTKISLYRNLVLGSS
mgnify:CR=1 FL=1